MADLAPLDLRWLREAARDEQELMQFLIRRRAGEPVHRILGWREFWGLRFALSPETLEPRPDSEALIEQFCRLSLPPAPRVLDLGTGTGCLLCAALHEKIDATGVGIDAAMGAVQTARRNAQSLGLAERAAFHCLDWQDAAALIALGPFDAILCNPPYIASAVIPTLDTEVKAHDPLLALDGGPDGLAPYRLLIPLLHRLLRPGGTALFEIGFDQGAAVYQLIETHGLQPLGPIKDLGGQDRVIHASHPLLKM